MIFPRSMSSWSRRLWLALVLAILIAWALSGFGWVAYHEHENWRVAFGQGPICLDWCADDEQFCYATGDMGPGWHTYWDRPRWVRVHAPLIYVSGERAIGKIPMWTLPAIPLAWLWLVRVRERRRSARLECLSCRYSLVGVRGKTCPECGCMQC